MASSTAFNITLSILYTRQQIAGIFFLDIFMAGINTAVILSIQTFYHSYFHVLHQTE